jgi:hypothetical protein
VFVGAFQNGLRAGKFNESLAHKPADSMNEIIAKAECYIKGEESNAEKKERDVKERTTSNSEPRNYQPHTSRDRAPYKKQERQPYAPYSTRPRLNDFTPLNTCPERILKEVYQSKMIPDASAPRGPTMGTYRNGWCKYHRIREHDTDSCIHLR